MRNKFDVVKHCSAWYQSLAGQTALAKTEARCEEIMSEIFGYYAIQIGMLSGELNLLKHSRIMAGFSLSNPSHELNLDNSDSKHQCAVILSNEHLPISTDNVDLVVASHVLETSLNPHQVLREIDRVLVPEGHCILIGFNPLALSNVNNLLRIQRQNDRDNYKMRSVHRVRDWFSLLGFEVLEVDYLGFRPALKSQKLSNSLQWLERYGEYAGLLLGSMYIVHAKKQVVAMRPDKKVWRAPALLKGGKVALNRTAQKVRRDNYSNL